MRQLTLALGLTLVLAGSVFGAVVEHTYTFDSPRIVQIGEYQIISFDDTYPAGKIGSPTLPFAAIELLLPPGEAVVSVEAEGADLITLDGSFRLLPQQPVSPISAPAGGDFVVDLVAYGSGQALPADMTPSLRTHHAKGLAVAVGSFTPVVYVPKSGTVSYYSQVTFRVHTESTARSRRALAMLPLSDSALRSAASRFDNPEILTAYSPRTTKQGGEYDYLIITRATYVDDFQPLADHYNRRGIRTQIQTVEYIDSNYSGVDPAERVRACIIDEYQNHGIQWVLLGGDADGPESDPTGKIVPYRGLYCAVQSSSLYEDEQIPSDCYFSGLDGDWNADADGRWGEPGEEDFYGEVHVGRAPVDSEAEIATFVTKATRYQNAPIVGEVRDVLLMGEHLWDIPETWGGDYMDELVGLCTNNGFTTNGIPAAYPIQKLYEKIATWSKADLMAAVNAGMHMIHHNGHSNTWYTMKMSDTDVTDVNFTNNGVNHSYCVVYTQGCLGGAFDNYYGGYWYSDECIGEEMMTINNFAAAAVINSRYGWFTEGTTNGPSQHFHREYVDALFSEGITTIGAAQTRSKDETAPFVDLPDEYEPGAHRWCFYCSNVFGDPAMDLWTDTPSTMTVTAPESVDRNATSMVVETGVDGALVALSRAGTLYGRAYADPTGQAEVTFGQSIVALDSLELVVTAHNYLVFEDVIPVTDMAPAAEPEWDAVQWRLAPCTPNPFSRETAIEFSLPRESEVTLRVFDVTGRTVARLMDGSRPIGRHRVVWTPDEDLAPGIYLCELRAGEFRAVRKVLRVR